ncbi:hypothetical protein GCM10028833_39190 [Glycomyces tarimensis]
MEDGREVRTAILDLDRAGHIKTAFRDYATGRYSVKQLRGRVHRSGTAPPTRQGLPSRTADPPQR